nr:immunoglobulin heavy chain junction region [Mus musculus]MBK4196318.1 immunoglobulin heavy chain junction region [Mus musculus]MBK4196319.1 immunoglobulin heavy chain junction region [Mus musculus]
CARMGNLHYYGSSYVAKDYFDYW